MSVTEIITLVVVAALAGLAFWLYRAGHFKRFVTFLGEVRTEMRKVSFPTREEVIGTTIVVIVTSVIFAIYLWIADLLIQKGYVGLIGVLGS
ncbi:MAG TPA: preprotein translocase subunit SecE [Thermoanaerobaculia bacterium]|nr:preprotein translocase subunit SecE [Thermoanaerobaculia bacterium]